MDKNIIKIIANKSHFQRLLICSILSNKKIRLNNYSNSEDNFVIINCFINLGYSIEIFDTYIYVNHKNRIKQNRYELDIKSSGFAARVLPIILVFEDANFNIKYDSRIFSRNLEELQNIFEQFGIEINIHSNYLEFQGNVNIQVEKIKCNGKISSQYASGLLLALALKKEFKLYLDNATSKNYLELTLGVLEQFGITIKNKDFASFSLISKNECQIDDFDIEGDWSGAANLMILAAIMGKGTFANLNIESKQADSIIYKLLLNIGIKIFISSYLLVVEKSKPHGFEFDATDCPDLVPALIPLAIYSQEKCRIMNVNRLKYKETNRLEELLISYQKLNANIEYNGDDFIIKPSNIIYQELDSKADHRLAMSFAIAYKLLNPKIQLIPEICVNKSYPNFYEQVNLIEIYE